MAVLQFSEDMLLRFTGFKVFFLIFRLAWSKDSRWIVSGSKDSTIKIWNTKHKKQAFDLPGHADEVFGVDWSPNGMQMASGGKDKMVRIWRN